METTNANDYLRQMVHLHGTSMLTTSDSSASILMNFLTLLILATTCLLADRADTRRTHRLAQRSRSNHHAINILREAQQQQRRQARKRARLQNLKAIAPPTGRSPTLSISGPPSVVEASPPAPQHRRALPQHEVAVAHAHGYQGGQKSSSTTDLVLYDRSRRPRRSALTRHAVPRLRRDRNA
ncbi:hypothetical protein C1H76_7356 [Elsinoe australis]|uniref:Uncharacterized protein n=1 Tax=Elsinoe australis TaxID=40998 RepID=A0A4U7ATV6_9PEZI|nr:hypothetical protein C1H76_7356 [Elsinoe australis]